MREEGRERRKGEEEKRRERRIRKGRMQKRERGEKWKVSLHLHVQQYNEIGVKEEREWEKVGERRIGKGECKK